MTVETDLDRAQYATNATTGPWTVPFYFLDETELAVTYTDATGVDALLVIDVDYTVVGVGDEDGGTITTTQAYAAGGQLVILRDVAFIQSVEYQDGDAFPAKTHERALDRLTMIAQQLREVLNRTLRFAASDSNPPQLPTAAARANTVLGFDSAGNIVPTIPASGSAADVLITLADTSSPAKNSGASGFAYALNYAARTVGWALKQGAVNIAWFSASVSGGDWTPAWQAAHNWAEAFTNGGYVVCPPGFVGQFKTAKVWNPNKVGFDGQGALLDYSAFSGAPYVVTNRQTSTDPNFRGCLNRAHPWRNFNAIGPGGTVTFMKIADTNPISGDYVINGVTVMNGSCTNFYRDIEIGDGAFHLNFISVDFNITGGAGYDTCIYVPVANNSGENINFTGCRFGKSSGSAARLLNPDSVLIFRGCSANYLQKIFECHAGSTLDWDGYIESNTDTDNWVAVYDQNTSVRIAGPLSLTGNKSAFEIFYVDSSCTNGGLDVDIVRKFGPVTYPLKLIGGTGSAHYRERGNGMASVHPAIGAGTNLLANGDFENTTIGLDDWTVAGTAALSTTYARSGTHCAKLTGAVGVTASMTRTVPWKPQDSVAGEIYFRADNLTGSGGTYVINVAYLDAAGNQLVGSATPGVTTNTGTWAQSLFSTQSRAPAGTVNARVSISLFGVTSVAGGTPAVYVDDGQLAVA